MVEVKYKGETILEMEESGKKILTSKNVWCEENIELNYVSKSRVYEITLAKSSGWTLLTELDDEILEHINNKSFIVSLVNISDNYVNSTFADSLLIAANVPVFYRAEPPAYGIAIRETAATNTNMTTSRISYPANNTESSMTTEAFRVSNGKYYVTAGAGVSIKEGTYLLTLSW